MDAQEANLYRAILITCAVLGVIIIFFIISLTRQQRKNLELHRQNILAEITALEKERSRIASDLHDELGPVLSAIKMKINSFDLHDPDDMVQMNKTNEHIDQLIKRVRGISYDLMPSSLIRKGLSTALKEFFDYANNGSKTEFRYEANKDYNLDEQKSINIYRIVQEIVHNTVKHAGASIVTMDAQVNEKELQLTITENGKGFDFEKASKESAGFGLRGLVSRTEMIGGHMYLDSVPGKGTKYTFVIPI